MMNAVATEIAKIPLLEKTFWHLVFLYTLRIKFSRSLSQWVNTETPLPTVHHSFNGGKVILICLL
jgi:hypothetical protein